jgi:cystathionine beta-lyase/cystathionine gamma-synthase
MDPTLWSACDGEACSMPSDGYYTARMLAEGYFASLGIEVHMAPTAGNAQIEYLDGATLLWLETPSNPGLDVCDLAVLIAAAHHHGVLVAVDKSCLRRMCFIYHLALLAIIELASPTLQDCSMNGCRLVLRLALVFLRPMPYGNHQQNSPSPMKRKKGP